MRANNIAATPTASVSSQEAKASTVFTPERKKYAKLGLLGTVVSYIAFQISQSLTSSDNTDKPTASDTLAPAIPLSDTSEQALINVTCVNTQNVTEMHVNLKNIFIASLKKPAQYRSNIYNHPMRLCDCFIVNQCQSAESDHQKYFVFEPSLFLQTMITYTNTQKLFAEIPIQISISKKNRMFASRLLKYSSSLTELEEEESDSHISQALLALNALIHKLYAIEHNHDMYSIEELWKFMHTDFTIDHAMQTYTHFIGFASSLNSSLNTSGTFDRDALSESPEPQNSRESDMYIEQLSSDTTNIQQLSPRIASQPAPNMTTREPATYISQSISPDTHHSVQQANPNHQQSEPSTRLRSMNDQTILEKPPVTTNKINWDV